LGSDPEYVLHNRFPWHILFLHGSFMFAAS
jgi:hypothetical protein